MNRDSRTAGIVLRLLAAVALLTVIGAATVYLVVSTTSKGEDAVDWAARRVVEIVERSIVPDVGFARFEYEAPRTLRFVGLTLTAPGGERVVEADSVEVELTEIPRIGQPVLIERIGLKRALVELIEARTPEGKVGFVGLVPFVTPRPGAAGGEARPVPTQGFEPEPRLSDVLRIRLIRLEDCGVRFTPMDGEPPMRLMGVNTDFRVTPTEEAGVTWHAFEVGLRRGNAMDASFSGRMDLDRFVIELVPSRLRIDLEQGTAEELPPAIQSFLTKHDARGALELDVSGSVPLRDAGTADVNAQLMLRGFNVGFGEYRLPIERALIQARLVDGIATAKNSEIETLDGVVNLSSSVEVFAPGSPAQLRWSASDLRLSKLLRGSVPAGKNPPLAGRVRSQGHATTALDDVTGALRGEGTVDVVQGHFAKIQLLHALLRSIAGNREGETEGAGTSEIHGEFYLRGPAVDFTSLTLQTPLLSARGDGVLWFDGTLDFVFNGGPLERVQDLLGEFGRIFGVVSDSLIKYGVRGTVSEPKISVLPLGIGAAPDRSELP